MALTSSFTRIIWCCNGRRQRCTHTNTLTHTAIYVSIWFLSAVLFDQWILVFGHGGSDEDEGVASGEDESEPVLSAERLWILQFRLVSSAILHMSL